MLSTTARNILVIPSALLRLAMLQVVMEGMGLTPQPHPLLSQENIMALEKVRTRARTYFGTNAYMYISSDNLK